jgi:cytochrome b561
MMIPLVCLVCTSVVLLHVLNGILFTRLSVVRNHWRCVRGSPPPVCTAWDEAELLLCRGLRLHFHWVRYVHSRCKKAVSVSVEDPLI